ncbi:hypothetical protein KC340_g7955 [Hortaea werneckii]|nr:hypothetical protein KC342_g6548 [Hortaea werneckii]KAI7098619.1 hypothetical protein KC339_g8833 [Hortaea werneckii]KAI7230421.1 hypothetical protein KC365_g7633 [Hortaea werneckii]KAI7319022.1 hypothetical protein KC340_g7955 [Hortaea werneckii]KAI7399920.1 hypothetical protein KC328_g3802 [Hortaea werneckii]
MDHFRRAGISSTTQSSTASVTAPETMSIFTGIIPSRETCEGALHPPHSYQAGEWKWHEKSEGYAAAIRDAFNCINKQDYMLAGEIAARVTSVKNDSTIDERPQEFYHPQYRPTVYRNSQALDSEVDAAMLARSLGYSLAIIVVEDFSPLQLLDPEAATPKVQARWSLGNGYELWPPLYVGHFLGSWFAVKLYDETEYEFWDSSRYDWARKAAQFRQHELNISQEDLIKFAVTVQRDVRAGFPGGRPSLDDLIGHYYQQSEQGMSEFQILEGWQQRTARLQTDILTVEWVTHAIACGNDEAAKEVANAFDVAYTAKARLMAGRPCDWYEDAANLLASQHSRRWREAR